MRIIQANGITNLAKIPGCEGRYYGTARSVGDIYETDELFRDRHETSSNRLILLHCPEGNVLELISAVVFHDGKICILLADFLAGMIRNTGIKCWCATIPPEKFWKCFGCRLGASGRSTVGSPMRE